MERGAGEREGFVGGGGGEKAVGRTRKGVVNHRELHMQAPRHNWSSNSASPASVVAAILFTLHLIFISCPQLPLLPLLPFLHTFPFPPHSPLPSLTSSPLRRAEVSGGSHGC